MVVRHFENTQARDDRGKYTVPLLMKADAGPLGESRMQVINRFSILKRLVRTNGQLKHFTNAVREYLYMGHAEPIPASDITKPDAKVYYFPMHAVRKADSTTSKVRVVFDASAKTATGLSLNDK